MANINRRRFIGTTIAAGSGILVSGVSSGKEITWDAECDVLVVGYGGAGAAAAIAAADRDASVILIDKQSEADIVNNTRMSGGIFHAPDKEGDKQALFDYCKAMFSGENLPWKEEGEQEEFSDELARAWVKYCPENVSFMQSLDPDFKAIFTPQAHGAAFPNFPGADKCGYQSYKSTYVARIRDGNASVWKKPKLETHSGEAFWLCLREGVAKRKDKIRELFGHKAIHLVKNDKGFVIGVKTITQTGKKLNFRARKGVILASGGYEYNKAMRKAFLEGPGVTGWAFYGALCNTGDGIQMGQEIGAGLAKVSACCSRVIIVTNRRENGMRIGCVTPTVGNKNTIVVDNYGRRYQAETKITDDPSRYFFYREAVKFDIDKQGRPVRVYFKIAKDANKLVEEFMLLANRTVAERIGRVPAGKKAKVFPYRIHDLPDPDKLDTLSQFIARFGYKLRTTGNKTDVSKSINRLLDDVQGKKEQNLIETVSIRAMQKARYSTHNIGHYGLAFDYYTHFTSPIRRYPDMMVHRLLTKYLDEKGRSVSEKKYEALCEHSSAMEQLAAQAERSSVKYKQVEFMQEHVGQVYDGVISGVTEWGLYVELNENKCEGMIPIRDLDDDYYEFDEKNYCLRGRRNKSHTYSLGDPITIRVARANLEKKQLDFALA